LSPHLGTAKAGDRKASQRVSDKEDDDDDDDALPMPAKRRPRVMAGFLVESSDEE
jgi:replication fork protection complex subunit Tof1/Swi1